MIQSASPDRGSAFQRRARMSESGRGTLGLIITLAILAAAGYTAFQVVPIYIHNYELNNYVNEAALEVVANRIKADDVPAAVVEKSEALNLPVELGDVRVDPEVSAVKIHVAYTVPVNLYFFIWPVHFSASASAPKLVY